ncbi:uncharacterized protein EHS24_009027 [Apiotrichum porosum]|uniref:Uncharacterized protein n=1 Tax=Apiotrichum porosum TaxID=105984 RepID=A0A427XP02_9TREE|nr:uncharacterized protein EHS24_009027 [Apiotrichum porosum]RSH80447.1 hypothetical protein EHS24_009027 [Apiotrichum porosum]
MSSPHHVDMSGYEVSYRAIMCIHEAHRTSSKPVKEVFKNATDEELARLRVKFSTSPEWLALSKARDELMPHDLACRWADTAKGNGLAAAYLDAGDEDDTGVRGVYAGSAVDDDRDEAHAWASDKAPYHQALRDHYRRLVRDGLSDWAEGTRHWRPMLLLWAALAYQLFHFVVDELQVDLKTVKRPAASKKIVNLIRGIALIMEVISQMLLGLVKGLPAWARHYGIPTLSGLHSLNEQAAVRLKPFPVRQPVVGPVPPTPAGLTRAFPPALPRSGIPDHLWPAAALPPAFVPFKAPAGSSDITVDDDGMDEDVDWAVEEEAGAYGNEEPPAAGHEEELPGLAELYVTSPMASSIASDAETPPPSSFDSDEEEGRDHDHDRDDQPHSLHHHHHHHDITGDTPSSSSSGVEDGGEEDVMGIEEEWVMGGEEEYLMGGEEEHLIGIEEEEQLGANEEEQLGFEEEQLGAGNEELWM